MGKSSAASASRRSSRSRGSTVTEIETNSPSLPCRAGDCVAVTSGQTLIKFLQHPAKSAPKQKTLGPKATGFEKLSTDLPLALFFTWLQLAWGPASGP